MGEIIPHEKNTVSGTGDYVCHCTGTGCYGMPLLDRPESKRIFNAWKFFCLLKMAKLLLPISNRYQAVQNLCPFSIT